jgi:hypothetical protein
MIQDAGTSLKLKALAQLIGRFGERFDRHLAAHGIIHAAVNNAHAANAQYAQDLVFADLRNWCRGIHGETPDSKWFSRQ